MSLLHFKISNSRYKQKNKQQNLPKTRIFKALISYGSDQFACVENNNYVKSESSMWERLIIKLQTIYCKSPILLIITCNLIVIK